LGQKAPIVHIVLDGRNALEEGEPKGQTGCEQNNGTTGQRAEKIRERICGKLNKAQIGFKEMPKIITNYSTRERCPPLLPFGCRHPLLLLLLGCPQEPIGCGRRRNQLMPILGPQLHNRRMIGNRWLLRRIIDAKFEHCGRAVQEADMVGMMMAKVGQKRGKKGQLKAQAEGKQNGQGKTQGTIVDSREEWGHQEKCQNGAYLGEQEGGGQLKILGG
jgi:hypothetical protein